jgi:hypothetical protein
MNMHFSKDVSNYRYELPHRVFARIDSVDNIDEETVVIGLDAVSEKSVMHTFSAGSSETWSALWLEAFEVRGERRTLATELLSEQQLYHIEIRQFRKDVRVIQESGALNSPSLGWMTVDLNRSERPGGISAAVFTGLFSEAIQVHLTGIKAVEPGLAESLMAVFSMRSWPTVSIQDLSAELHDVEASYWAAYDVGQGSANGLLRSNGQVAIFHDIGCGVYRNASTRPKNLVLCNSHEAPIILSHWDTDHWAGARYFAPNSKPNAFLNRTWIAPYDLTVGPRHIAFASSILAAGGKLVLLRSGALMSSQYLLSDGRILSLIRGGGGDRNGSGIAMEVWDVFGNRERWLMTGDVSYQHLKPHIFGSYAAMSVPHHGSRLDASVAVPSPGGTKGNSRLIYSFGANNSFRHPKQECVNEHARAGWAHPSWVPHSNIATGLAGGNVVATACHQPGPNHLGAILVGWNGPPATPRSLHCNGQCNALLMQS